MRQFLEIVFILMLMAIANTLLSGCAALPNSQTSFMDGASTNTQIIYQTIRSINWVASLLLVGVVLGLIAAFGLGFKQLGLVTSGACVAGLFLSAAMSNTFFYVAAGLVVLASIIFVIAGLIWKHRAMVELVKGGNELLRAIPAPKTVKKTLQEQQSKHTQSMVQQIKGKLKVKDSNARKEEHPDES